ncbi:MAG: ATP-binding protein, partial [Dehalococcoidia bacterium]
PANVELSVFRIAQEALNNVHRHAHASTAKVVLDFAEEWITLTISDDGCGFQVPERLASLVGKGKLGVIGMNERSLDIGATLKIESKPGQGTVISIQIPQPGAAQESGKVFEGPPIKPSRTSSKTSNLSQ